MIVMPMLNQFPNKNIEEGIKILDKMYWFISTGKENDNWNVYAGEKVIFRTDSKETLDAFLYGMALTFVPMPEKLVDYFSEEIKRWVE